MIKSEAPRAAVDMELEETQADAPSAPVEEAVDGSVVKKQKVDKSVEEERLEKLEEGEGRGEGEVLEEEKSGPITIGPKTFESSTDMFDYFFKFLHHWSPNFDVNKEVSTVTVELGGDKKEVSNCVNCDGVGSLTCTTCQGSRIQPRYLDRREFKDDN